MARRVGDPAALAHVLNVRSHVIWAPDTLHERLANTAEHVAVAVQLGDPLGRWYASATRPQACMEAGDVAEVDHHLAFLWELTLELGRPHQLWAATIDRAWRALLGSQIAAAESLATEACEIGTASGQRDALGYYSAQLIAIRFDQGRLDELVPMIEGVVARRPSTPLMRASLALAYCELDRADDARRILDAAFASRFEDVPLDMAWLTEMATYAEVSARLGARPPAMVLYDRLAPWPKHVVFNGVYVFGSVSRSLALLASAVDHHDEAEGHFAVAASVHEGIGAPALLARTRLDWAQMLLRRLRAGDRARASTLLSQALATARDLGLASIERRARSLLDT
jgi:tetratricopeptide (TPR) repeat protein